MSEKPVSVPKDALYPSEPDPWTIFMVARLKTLNTFINSDSVSSRATLRALDVEVSNLNRLVSCVHARRKVLSFVSEFSSKDLARGFLHLSQATGTKLGSAKDIARPRFVALDVLIKHLYDNVKPEKALQIAEAELLNMQHVLQVVRWLRNGCRPVSRIPPEILAHIFWFCRHDPTQSLEDGARCIISVSHVCHRWRKAALDHAYLWGTVTSLALGEKWMIEMLKRAKQAPLRVHSSAMLSPQSKPVKPLNLSMLKHRLSHIERLEISDHVDDLEGFLQLLVKSAPILEYLSFTSKRVLTVPPKFLTSYIPRLRMLRLSGLLISWTSPFLTNLTTLDLRLPQGHLYQNSIPSLMQFCETLDTMQRLEVLRMLNCLPKIPPRRAAMDHVRRKPIALPHLSEIELQGSLQECVVVTRSIQVLPATVLKLYFGAEENNNDLVALFPVIKTVSGHSDERKPWRGLSIFESLGFNIKAWKSSRPPRQARYPEGDVYIQINYVYHHARDLAPLRSIYETLCLPDLSAFSLVYPSMTRIFPLAEYWLPLPCQQLRHIFVWDGIWVWALIDALRPTVTSSGDDASHTKIVPFPHLKSLDLTCYDGLDFKGKRFKKEMREVIKQRNSLQAPLDSIKMEFYEGVKSGSGFFS